MRFLKDVTFFIRNGASIKQRKGCSGIPITRIETISNGRFNYDRLGYADIFDSDTYKKYYLEDNDVLFSHINSEKFLGRTVLYHPKNKTENIIHGMNLLCLRFNQSEYSPEFFYWYSKSSTAKEFYRINTKHAVNQASIPSSAIKEMPIPDFTLNKQYTIVHSLNQIQSSIDYKLDQITKLESLVKSRFIEMFGNPISEQKWIVKKWNEVLEIKNGKDYKKNLSNKENGYPVYGSGGFMNIYADTYLCEGIITIIGRKGNINNPLLVEGKIWNVDTAFGIIVKSDILNPIFFHHCSKFYDYEKLNKATTIPSLTKSDLLNLEIIIPPIELQDKFADFVHLIDKSRFDQRVKIKDLFFLISYG